MKKLLFLLLSAAVAVSASAGVARTIDKKVVKNSKATTKVEQVVKTAYGPVASKPAPMLKAPVRIDIPEGYCAVTLAAGDVWGDGSGYQMLLDADATAYGVEIPTTGGLTASGDATAEVYAAFEYKIPENADGAMTTQNIIMNGSATILIPAGTYDWCITNPTPDDRIWIASENGDVPGRYDDYQFAAGMTYIFTVSLSGSNDYVALQVVEPGIALTVPENLTVNPAATTADVAWDDTDDVAWNLRYRPYVDTSSNPINLTLPNDDEILDAQLEGISILDVDQDGNNWGLAYTDEAQTDLCLASSSYSGGALTPDNWLILPLTKLQGVIKFDAWHKSSYPEKLEIMIGMEDAISGNTVYTDQFTTIASYTTEGNTPVTYSIDLSSYNGQMGYVVFRHYGTTNQWTLYVDNIFVGDPNAEIIEKPEWIYENGLGNTNITLNGLTPETLYEVQVQAAGSVSTSDWTDVVYFTTLAEGGNVKIGDVNRDGVVNIADVTALIDALLSGNLDDTDTFSYDNSDCNADETVNIADVTTLIDMLLSGNV